MQLEKGLAKYHNLDRDEYFEKNQELSSYLWEKEDVPTVFDIADFMCGNENQKMNKIFDFFDNKEEFMKMASRTNAKYNQEESANFIRKVMSANNEDISKAGYFYKLLMASADDFTIQDVDCGSEGVKWNISDITENIYNYKIKSMFITELKIFADMNFDEFKIKCKDLNVIHVRTPLTCKHSKKHGICKVCSGKLPKNTINVGTFTTLMVTEHATQSALSSMNKGLKENINDLLALRYDGPYNWESILPWIESVVDKLENDKVQSRFYEIALLSRVREDEYGPFVSSLKGSINHSGNPFGAYIFTPNHKNFERIIKERSFDDNSLKLKIAMNDYRK